MTDEGKPHALEAGRWQQLNKCPVCGVEMPRELAARERVGLFYRCPEHGRFRYSWDYDELKPDHKP